MGAPRLINMAELELFTTRELSFLGFNHRVIEEAKDRQVPLLERLKFLAISALNLDELFMIRFAGLKHKANVGSLRLEVNGSSSAGQFKAVLDTVARQVAEREQLFLDEIRPELASVGLQLVDISQLNAASWFGVAQIFERDIFPILTPLAVDQGHPFPFLKNNTLALAIRLVAARGNDSDLYPLMAVVQIPSILPRFIRIPQTQNVGFVRIEELIKAHVGKLFPGMRILECVTFRVIRHWDLSIDDTEHADLLEALQREIQNRWRLHAVRLEVESMASDYVVDSLREFIGLEDFDIQKHRGPLAFSDYRKILDLVCRQELRDSEFRAVMPLEFSSPRNIFDAIRDHDVLLHHPYESYEPVLRFLDAAAVDSQVLSIKQTLYRSNRDSAVVEALIRAARSGKQVTVLVELKARFHEERNIEWARKLEEAGVHVIYGVSGLKTHCKVLMVVRREAQGICRYVHLGTGNYDEHSAQTRTDLSFFTVREDIGKDVSSLFNVLTGYTISPVWEKLIVAPVGLRNRLVELIERARNCAQNGLPARIVIKTNALIDEQLSALLIMASQAGVEVDLLVRGPCTLRVGIRGYTDRIRVRMIIDRFLEHSRVFYFLHNTEESVFITSTDIMYRNLDSRIEVMLPIEDERIRRRIIDEILAIELQDDAKASLLGSDGSYTRSRGGQVRAQSRFIALARQRALALNRKQTAHSQWGSMAGREA